MCRWMAWFGQPLLLEELLFKTQHGIVDQALHARMGAEPTNGDGFGLGWYDEHDGPGRYRSVAAGLVGPEPARARRPRGSHRCLWRTSARRSARRCRRPTATRSATGAGCSPTTAMSRGFHELRRELMLQLRPDLFPEVQGSTDTEVLFHLALTFGLERDPLAALERTIGLVEDTAQRAGIDDPVQGSFGDQQRRDAVGHPLCQRRPSPVAVRLRRCRRHPPTASRERATGPSRCRRPPRRLRAVLRPPRRLAARRAVDGADGATRRCVRAHAVCAAARADHLGSARAQQWRMAPDGRRQPAGL